MSILPSSLFLHLFYRRNYKFGTTKILANFVFQNFGKSIRLKFTGMSMLTFIDSQFAP
jgi:hypothetical protein